jgi:hypothetical protein
MYMEEVRQGTCREAGLGQVQVPREAGEGETGTVERLAWAKPGAARRDLLYACPAKIFTDNRAALLPTLEERTVGKVPK